MKTSVQVLQHVVQIIVLLVALLGFYNIIKPVTIVFLLATMVFGNLFCGRFCPFGTMQEIMGKIGGMIIKNKLKTPLYIQRYLQFSRIVLMVLMLLGVSSLFFSNINAYLTFFETIELNQIVMTTSVIMMFSFLIVSIIFERPF